MLIPIRDHNPTRRFPVVTVGIIAVNIIVFIMQVNNPDITRTYSAIPAELTGTELPFFVKMRMVEAGIRTEPIVSPFLTIFTSMFLHGGFLHILFNMWSLWIFGNNVEDRLGHFRYLLLYLIWGFVAVWAHVLFNWGSPIQLVGASGAIAGVMGAYLLLFPHARLDCVLFFFIITFVEVPAIFFLVLWFISQFFFASPGVAYLAHIGGFVAGVATIKLLGIRPQPLPNRWYDDDDY